jgi:hypothetical protein
MPLDLSMVAAAPDLSSNFTVLRSNGGQWVNGIWVDSFTAIPMYGPVSIASPKDLEMIPEGDRPSSAMVFWTTQIVYETQGPTAGVHGKGISSDMMQWNNLNYRILQVAERPMNGYYRAVATRMLAD